MKNFFYRFIFKMLRLIRQNWCRVKLDFDGAELWLIAENWREYNVRANSCRKEPETVDWLKKNCHEGEVLFDIGANVGAYTLVGAALGAEVLSFEPSFSNFNRLNENISINGFDQKVKTFPVAFSRQKRIGMFHFLDATAGSSACYYNESGQFNSKLKTITTSKAVLVYNLDSFINEFALPYPTLIKIDVDGAEFEILEGAKETLKNPACRTLILEVDHRIVSENDIMGFLIPIGYVKINCYPRGSDGVFNYVFERSQG